MIIKNNKLGVFYNNKRPMRCYEQANTKKYLCRKTNRENSEAKIKKILNASLNIMITRGSRFVRHRLIANEAQVSLSATTYYFKDIDDLISDTFIYFLEEYRKKISTEWDVITCDLEKKYNQLPKPSNINKIASMYANSLLYFALNQLKKNKQELIAEKLLEIECLKNNILLTERNNHYNFLSRKVRMLLNVALKNASHEQASFIIRILKNYEQECLLTNTDRFNHIMYFTYFKQLSNILYKYFS
jgi:DNA-binding transcriptional regulator YbjK